MFEVTLEDGVDPGGEDHIIAEIFGDDGPPPTNSRVDEDDHRVRLVLVLFYPVLEDANLLSAALLHPRVAALPLLAQAEHFHRHIEGFGRLKEPFQAVGLLRGHGNHYHLGHLVGNGRHWQE